MDSLTVKAGVAAATISLLAMLTPACAGNRNPALPAAAALALPDGWRLYPETNQVNALALQGESLWIGSLTGLHRIDAGTSRPSAHVDAGEQVTHVRSLLVDHAGVLWIGHVNGLTSWDGAQFRHYGEADGLPYARVNALALDSQGGLLIGTGKGLARMKDGRIVAAPENPRLASPIVSSILDDGGGSLWIASNSDPAGGLARFDSGGCQIFRAADGLPHSHINRLMLARDGAVWAATGFLEAGGVCVFARADAQWRILRRIGTAEGMAEPNIRSVFQDRDGDFWVGFESRGAALMTGTSVRHLDPEAGFPSKDVPCWSQGSDGTLWVGTTDGVLKLTPQAVDHVKGR